MKRRSGIRIEPAEGFLALHARVGASARLRVFDPEDPARPLHQLEWSASSPSLSIVPDPSDPRRAEMIASTPGEFRVFARESSSGLEAESRWIVEATDSAWPSAAIGSGLSLASVLSRVELDGVPGRLQEGKIAPGGSAPPRPGDFSFQARPGMQIRFPVSFSERADALLVGAAETRDHFRIPISPSVQAGIEISLSLTIATPSPVLAINLEIASERVDQGSTMTSARGTPIYLEIRTLLRQQ